MIKQYKWTQEEEGGGGVKSPVKPQVQTKYGVLLKYSFS